MPKDRIWRRRLAPDLVMVVERTSTHPIEYAIVLLLERDAVLHTVRTFDNATGRLSTMSTATSGTKSRIRSSRAVRSTTQCTLRRTS